MSEYGAITPTTNGLTMITESVVKKKPIVFTKIAIGDGALTNQNIEALTALIRQKQEAPIHIVTDKGTGLADVSAVITNAGLSTGYYARELGVFAKVGDTGQEKLFAYTNAGANASYSPADGSLDEKLITVTFKIGTGATLKVALNSQVYLTLGNLEEHNTSSSAHADIRTKITSDINAHNSSGTSHADIRRMFNSYLPLTGGTVTGPLHVNNAVIMGGLDKQFGNFIEKSKAGTMYLASGKSENSNLSWFNVDGYFKYPNTADMCVIKRDENANILARAFLLDQDNKTRFPNEVYSNNKLLATKEYVDAKGTNDLNAHNTSGGAHADIRQMFTWKKLYSVNRDAFTLPAQGTALCNIPSMWKELHITWIWRGDKSTINTVVGYEAYTINIVNEVTGDPIIFVAPGSEGYMTVKNNKLYVIHRGDSNDGAPVLVMWR